MTDSRIMREKALEGFETAFGGASGARVFFAPGRVNLIGEHTDYNGGHVFPCALSMGIYCAAKLTNDGIIRLRSAAFPGEETVECGIDELSRPELTPEELGQIARRGSVSGWAIYPLGSLRSLVDSGCKIGKGLELFFDADLPTGSGLSSSAAMEVLTLTAADALLELGIGLEPGREIDRCAGHYRPAGIKKALIAQRAENVYAGVPCGIMDQFASAMGEKDHALLLDTGTLEYEAVPLKLKNAKIYIVNSMVKHSLAGSAYADRRRECTEALDRLNAAGADIPALCALSPERFEELAPAAFFGADQNGWACRACAAACMDARTGDDPKQNTIYKRVRHAVYENDRALRAAAFLKDNDISGFGRLMNASHVSLRDDFEVSCPELDFLAETAWSIPGVYGSRMTGGGFGGCTVSIVADDAAESFVKTLKEAYLKRFGIECEVLAAAPADGAGEL